MSKKDYSVFASSYLLPAVLDATSEPALFQHAMALSEYLLGVDIAAMYVSVREDDPASGLALAACWGEDNAPLPRFISCSRTNLPGLAVLDNILVVSADTAPSGVSALGRADEVMAAAQMAFGVAAPIVYETRVIGALVGLAKPTTAISPRMLDAANSLAALISVLLTRLRLSERVSRQVRRQQALLSLSTQLARAETADEIYHLTATHLHQSLGYASVGIFTYEATTQTRTLVASVGAGEDQIGLVLRPGEGLSELPTRDKVGHLTADVTRERGYVSVGGGLSGSAIDLPIIVEDGVAGVLSVESPEPNTLDVADVELLSTAASLMGVALARVHLLREERRRADELEAMSATLNDIVAEQGLDWVLSAIIERAVMLVGGTGGGVGLYRPDMHVLEVRAGYNIPEEMIGQQIPPGHLAIGVVAQTGQPLIVNDYQAWLAERFSVWSKLEWTAVMAVPMTFAEGLVGVLAVVSTRKGYQFSERSLKLLTLLGQQAAVAVRNAQLYEAAKVRGVQAEKLREASAAVTLTLHQGELVQRVLVELRRVVPYDSASLQLLRGGELEIIGMHGDDDWSHLIGLRFPVPGPNPNTFVISQRKPLILDREQLEHYPAFRKELFVRQVRSWMGLPLMVGDELIGMMTIDRFEDDAFVPDDLRLASAFVGQVAVAVKNVQLYNAAERRAQELQVLSRAAQVLSQSLEPVEVATRLMGMLVEALDMTSGILARLTADGTGLTVVAVRFEPDALEHAWGELQVGMTFLLAEYPHVQAALETGAPQVLHATDRDLSAMEQAAMQAAGGKTAVIVPMGAGGRFEWGVFLGESRYLRQITADEIALCMSLVGISAGAIENAQLFQAEQRQREIAEGLREIMQLASESLDVGRMLTQITRRTAAICRVERCTVLLLDSTGQVLKPAMSQYADGRRDNALWQAFRQERAVWVNKVPAFARALETGDVQLVDFSDSQQFPAAWQQMFHLKQVMVVPLLNKDTRQGVLVLDTQQAVRFTDEQVALARTISQQVVSNIANARLYALAREDAETRAVMQQASREISASRDVQGVCEAVYGALQTLLPVEVFYVGIYDAVRQMVDIVFVRDAGQAVSLQCLALEGTLTGYVVQQRVGLRIDQREELEQYAYFSFGQQRHVQSLIVVPLWLKDQVFGVMSVQSYQPRAYTESHFQVMSTMANQVAVALENALLFEAMARRARELEALFSATQSLLSTLTLDELLDQIISSAMRALPNATRGAVLLRTAEQGEMRVRAAQGFRAWHGLEARLMPVMGQAIAENGPVVKEAAPLETSEPDVRVGLVTVPFRQEAEIVGGLVLEVPSVGAVDATEKRLLEVFATAAVAAIRNAELHEEVSRMARVDALTGVYNRHHFFEVAQEMLADARRGGYPLVVMLCDIDKFKQVNDTFGHRMGDRVLSTVAQAIQGQLRSMDVLGRYGGEEFVAVLPNTTVEMAVALATQILAAVRAVRVDGAQVSISIGLMLANETATLEGMFDAADQAMYRAKRAGGNQIAVGA